MNEEEAKYTIIEHIPVMGFTRYRQALRMAINALEKQVPMKPIYSEFDDNGFEEIIPYKAECPTCGYKFEFGTFNEDESHHCVCGQKMDWSKDAKQIFKETNRRII